MPNWKNSVFGHKVYLLLESLFQYWLAILVFLRGIGRFVLLSSSFRRNYSQANLEARLIAFSRRIEKAYSLPNTRLRFGYSAILELSNLITP
jgi:hypothetical protein